MPPGVTVWRSSQASSAATRYLTDRPTRMYAGPRPCRRHALSAKVLYPTYRAAALSSMTLLLMPVVREALWSMRKAHTTTPTMATDSDVTKSVTK